MNMDSFDLLGPLLVFAPQLAQAVIGPLPTADALIVSLDSSRGGRSAGTPQRSES
jgi:hypothetical protein